MFRESTEWSQLYWFDTASKDLPRIMLIGDSIVVGHAPELAKILKGKATVAFFATSRIVGDPAYSRELMTAMADMPVDLIEFNNGLHGFQYNTAFYRRNLEMTLDHLQSSFRCPIRWRNSTPISRKDVPAEWDPERNHIVTERNLAAQEVISARNIPEDDMYSLVQAHPEWRSMDGYHYNDDGKQKQAEFLAEILLNTLAKR